MTVRSINRWLLSLIFLLPVLALYYSHYQHRTPDKVPSFFLQDDMPYYMAIAREYFDAGQSPLAYGNPFSPNPDTPRHYFQPITFLMGIVLSLTHLNPGLIFLAFGVITGLISIRVAIGLFETIQPLEILSDLYLLTLFIWGGGILAIGGSIYSYWTQHNLNDWLLFDPSGGWWLLNLGRNFVYPLESLYHLLFFLGIYFWIKKQWSLGLVAGFLLSISHPFTGIQYLTISLCWLILERWIKEIDLPLEVILTCALMALLHVVYYLVLLNRDEEHRSVMEAWKIAFSMNPLTFALNLFPLGFIIWWGLRQKAYIEEWLHIPTNRLFLIGFFVTLGLVFHDRVIRPIQPLHFDRGYLWSFLFLLSLPAWNVFSESIPHKRLRFVFLLLLGLLFLSDNISWISHRIQTPTGYYHTPSQVEVYDWLNRNATSQDLLVTQEQKMAYLAPTYSPVRPWYAFWWFTPHHEHKLEVQKSFFSSGVLPEEWKKRSILILQSKQSPKLKTKLKKLKVFENADYYIYQIQST